MGLLPGSAVFCVDPRSCWSDDPEDQQSIAGCVVSGYLDVMQPTPSINVSREKLGDFCRRHHIRRLSLFGSVLREDSRADSDVDALAEFKPGHTPGWEITDIQDELSSLFGGRRVDMVNPQYFNHRLEGRIPGSPSCNTRPRRQRDNSVYLPEMLDTAHKAVAKLGRRTRPTWYNAL